MEGEEGGVGRLVEEEDVRAEISISEGESRFNEEGVISYKSDGQHKLYPEFGG